MSRIFANPLAELIEYEEMNQELERAPPSMCKLTSTYTGSE